MLPRLRTYARISATIPSRLLDFSVTLRNVVILKVSYISQGFAATNNPALMDVINRMRTTWPLS